MEPIYINKKLLNKNKNKIITLDDIKQKTKYKYIQNSDTPTATMYVYYNNELLYKFENQPLIKFEYILELFNNFGIEQI